jgi:hypothetical protein
MSFSTAFTVDRSPDQVFAAINDVRSWWTGEACSTAWRYYVNTSLRNRIVTGGTSDDR